MKQRNRASGWKYAKLTGHTNESAVKEILDTNTEYKNEFMKRINFSNEIIAETSIGGLHETNVIGVLGKKTKSKTDLKIKYKSGKSINISIKKSLSGQVYLVKAELFIEVFKKQFSKDIPNEVQKAIKLFYSKSNEAVDIIKEYGDKLDIKNYNLQIRHKSINAKTLKEYNINLYNIMLKWFKDNIYEVTRLSFAMGAAKEKEEWSDFVWYINLLGENDIDEIFFIEDICKAAKKNADQTIIYGDRNGGTTIQLPFGFIQWHQGKMQFHHSNKKIYDLLK